MQLRFAMMFWVSSLAGAFSGLLAYGIRNLNGKHGISGWQWIIIVVGSFPIPLACDHVTGANVHRGFRARHTLFLSLLHKRPSSYSQKKSMRGIVVTLPMTGVALLTLMGPMKRFTVGAKSQVRSRMRPMSLCFSFPCFLMAQR